MQAHFKYLRLKRFPMVKGYFQSNEIWPFKSIFENLGLHRDSNSQNESPLGNVWIHSLTLLHSPESVNVTPEFHSRPPPFHALALVASQRLGSWHINYVCIFIKFKSATLKHKFCCMDFLLKSVVEIIFMIYQPSSNELKRNINKNLYVL